MADEIYQKLESAYNPEQRCAECPDEDALWLKAMEFEFGIPVWLTGNQQRRLHQLLHEVVSAPWNQPAEGVHWLAGWGSKPQWREPQEPTFNDEILHGDSCARQFVADTERARTLKERDKPKTPDIKRDTAIEALESVMFFWQKDPEAFGDDATLTSIASQFEKVARKCGRALAILREEQANHTTPPA